MNVSTGLQRDLLYLIAGRERTPRPDLDRAIAEYYGAEIRHDRLTSNLDTLVETDLVESMRRDGTDHYTLTDRGRDEIEARREWESRHLDTDGE
ncbi:helix-turn-helix domain-containing protein [Halalkalicoccus jeotgali]|uniref:Transcription regulator n=1 Tax=Halalkalicoccus jeotgali (strain DSM 18796 / CECT 7217 / JCM 14584 / KCTC 4019 / B3) TaxID=795797 RepID=D8J488_HALJB|nr:transcriptional regulator [Halalkalicoccus jeotgali]ADJ15480.1 transcription regulator [Halalkalicoccus jeotgali B3]ELY36111.1 transcriptional regulator [Halalkalicoccus jeotgali B3]